MQSDREMISSYAITYRGLARRRSRGLVLPFGARARRAGTSHSFGGFELAHRWSVEFQPIGIVDDAIENGVGEGWFADDLVSVVYGGVGW